MLWCGCRHRRLLPAFLWCRQQLRRTGKKEWQTLLQMSVSKSQERVSSAAVNKENGSAEAALAFDWAKLQLVFLIMFPMLKSKLAGKTKKCPPLFGTCPHIHLSEQLLGGMAHTWCGTSQYRGPGAMPPWCCLCLSPPGTGCSWHHLSAHVQFYQLAHKLFPGEYHGSTGPCSAILQ